MKQKGTKLYITLFTLQLKIIAALVYYIKTKENLKLSRQYQNKIYLKTKFSLNDRIMYIQYNNYILTKEKLLTFNSLILSNTEKSCIILH